MISRRPAWASRLLPVVAIAAAAALVPAGLLVAVAGEHVMIAPMVHVVVVGAAGALAATAAVAMSVIAARVNDGRAVLLGTAFSVMATMLVVHALSTPGAWMGDNGLMRLAGALNVPVGAGILAASALPGLRLPRHARDLLRIQLAVLTALAAAAVVALTHATDIPAFPVRGSDAVTVVFVIGAGALGLLAWRAGRTYLLTHRVSDLLVTVGLVWLIAGQYGLLDYGMMDAEWWLAHVFEVVGIGLVGIPAVLDLRYGIASRPLLGDLRPAKLVADEEAFLGARVRALMLRLAEKDPSTENHTRRVAALAVEIGERLGLAERRLRILAVGGLLHDMGKLAVPDEILKKPAKLSDDEFAVIRSHPAWGRELLAELGGFAPLVLRLVESHHERLDAGGYPHHQAAGDLELEVRILAVADVYDALTDQRIYRPAWPPSQAFQLLASDAGRAFDRSCVRALSEILVDRARARIRDVTAADTLGARRGRRAPGASGPLAQPGD